MLWPQGIEKSLFTNYVVLKSTGELGILSMPKEDGESALLGPYEWAYKK